MARTSKIILIPKPAESSFNKNRSAGKLLQSQTAHLRHALLLHLQEIVALVVIDPSSIKTEREVSAYAQKVMSYLHPHGAKQQGK
jgi:hypothetical protein